MGEGCWRVFECFFGGFGGNCQEVLAFQAFKILDGVSMIINDRTCANEVLKVYERHNSRRPSRYTGLA